MSMDESGSVREYWQAMGNANCISDMAATAKCPPGKSASSCVTAVCYGTDNKLWYSYVTSSNGSGKWSNTGLKSP